MGRLEAGIQPARRKKVKKAKRKAAPGEPTANKQKGSSAVAATAQGILQAMGLKLDDSLTDVAAKGAAKEQPVPDDASKKQSAAVALEVEIARTAGPRPKKRKQQRAEGAGAVGVSSDSERVGKHLEAPRETKEPEGHKPSGKAQKRMKVLSHIHAKGDVFTPSTVSARTFDTDPTDHCETPFEAYRDIEPFLFRIAQGLGKSKAELSIYDPYYCEGSMMKHLRKLGFSSIYNKNEDFYRVIEEGRVPSFDVLVTNPPFSGDHMKKIVRFCVEHQRPFFLLMPNFVLKKTYFKDTIAAGPPSMAEPSFLAPQKAYKFWSPGRRKFCSRFVANTRGGVGDAVPFETIWYIGGYSKPEAANTLKWWQKKYTHTSKCTFAAGEQELPERVVPIRVTGGEKRPNPRQRKALAKKRRAGVAGQ